jgi:hypothetical protein
MLLKNLTGTSVRSRLFVCQQLCPLAPPYPKRMRSALRPRQHPLSVGPQGSRPPSRNHYPLRYEHLVPIAARCMVQRVSRSWMSVRNRCVSVCRAAYRAEHSLPKLPTTWQWMTSFAKPDNGINRAVVFWRHTLHRRGSQDGLQCWYTPSSY